METTLLGVIDRVAIAEERFKTFYPTDGRIPIIAFSGGKDSVVTLEIAKLSGLPFKAIYSKTSVDPPELIYFMREHYPEVISQPYKKDKEGNIVTMFTLIPKKLMPPTRMVRYCCDVMKERTGEKGDTIYTGIRWSESKARSQQKMVNFWKGKIMVRPIVDWSDDDVWEFIKSRNLPYCKLYDQGFKRIGCIGCPLSPQNMKKELDLYPKIKANYIRAFERMIKQRELKGKVTKWETGEEVMSWWIGESVLKEKPIEGQCTIF